MEIKTIKYRLDAAEQFDADVNKALSNGWILKKRYIAVNIVKRNMKAI